MMNNFDTSTEYAATTHLLRRAGYAASPEEIAAAKATGISAVTDRLLNYESVPDPIDDEAILIKLQAALPEELAERAGDRLPVNLIKLWWTYRLIASPRPLQEKMTMFWHNHFTSKDDGLAGDVMYRQNQLYRQHALGNFRTLTLAVAKDPEMLRYLNGNQNFKAHPNENFARELMELYTCGRVDPSGKPNYTEDDVKAGARAFSGWNSRGGAFYYNATQHDDTPKTFMGRTGNFNGDDIIDILVSLPATANYMCRKLFRYFAYEDPEPEVMKALVATYYGSGYDIKAIVSTILRSNAFYSPKARFALIKSPVDYVVGTIRMAGIGDYFTPPAAELTMANDVSTPLAAAPGQQSSATPKFPRRGAMGLLASAVGAFRSMGQDILAPPSVKGWDGGSFWINTDSLQARSKFAANISRLPALPVSQWDDQLTARTAAFASAPFNATSIVDSLLFQFGPMTPTVEERQILVKYGQTLPNAEQATRGLLSLVLAMPDYQVF